MSKELLLTLCSHTHTTSHCYAWEENSKHFSGSDILFCQVLTLSCWQNTFSQKLKSFCQGNLFCSIILLVDKCSKGKKIFNYAGNVRPGISRFICFAMGKNGY